MGIEPGRPEPPFNLALLMAATDRPRQGRKLLKATLDDGRVLQAWVYVYNRSVAAMRRVRGGDYLSYLKPAIQARDLK